MADFSQNNSTPMMQENSITWDLIAESSKNETPEVYSMILDAFNKLDDSSSTNEQNTMKSTYLSYPKEELEKLVEELKVHRV